VKVRNNTPVLRVWEIGLRVWSAIWIDNDDKLEVRIFADTERLNALEGDGLTPPKGGPIFREFAGSGGRCKGGQ